MRRTAQITNIKRKTLILFRTGLPDRHHITAKRCGTECAPPASAHSFRKLIYRNRKCLARQQLPIEGKVSRSEVSRCCQRKRSRTMSQWREGGVDAG